MAKYVSPDPARWTYSDRLNAQAADAKTKKSNNAWAARYEAQARSYSSASKNPSKSSATPTSLTRGQQADAARLTNQYVQSLLYPRSIYWNASGTPVITNDRTPSATGRAILGVPPKTMRPLVGEPELPGSSPVSSSGSDYWSGGSGGYGSSYGSSYGGSSGSTEEVPVTWEEFDSGVTGAPPFWKALKPSVVNDATEYLAGLNMLIPFLSAEDQRTVASNLYTQDATNFGHLNPEAYRLLQGAGEPSTRTRQMFTDSMRAQQALAALGALAGAVGKTDKDMGTGYRYLRSILNVGNQFGGNSSAGNAQNRRQYANMLAALDPLIAQAQTQSLAPYESIVKMLTSPFFSGGRLRPVMKDASGKVIFGTPNKSWL